jgi:hypothetical protein
MTPPAVRASATRRATRTAGLARSVSVEASESTSLADDSQSLRHQMAVQSTVWIAAVISLAVR